MPTREQRVENAQRAYHGSALHRMNKAIRLAANLDPLRKETPAGQSFVKAKSSRVTTLADLHEADNELVNTLSYRFEPHILIEDVYNPGRYNPLWVAAGIDDKANAGRFACDTEKGLALLHADTIIYWR